jgi:hypothetical protein
MNNTNQENSYKEENKIDNLDNDPNSSQNPENVKSEISNPQEFPNNFPKNTQEESNILNENQMVGKYRKISDSDYVDINKVENFLNPDYYDEFGRPKYEEIIQFQNELVKEIEHTSPLVSDKMGINYLISEFKDSHFVTSIKEIEQKYKFIRTVRRDGNCFYRSFMFRLFEQLSLTKNQKLYNNVLKIIEESKDLIVRNGTQWFVLEDFYNIFLSEWKFVYQLDPLNTNEYMYTLF